MRPRLESLAAELNLKNVRFDGYLAGDSLWQAVAQARFTVLPSAWYELFGQAVIESLACGTPVVAFDNGSVSEVLSDGETGYIVNSIDEAVVAVKNIHRLSRTDCRETFLKRFSVQRMVEDYLSIYAATVEQFRRIRLPVNAGMRSDEVSSNFLSA